MSDIAVFWTLVCAIFCSLIALSLALSPIVAPVMLVMAIPLALTAVPCVLSAADPILVVALACGLLVAVAAQVVRPVVMRRALRRSWRKTIFVLYVTYWPIAFLFAAMARR